MQAVLTHRLLAAAEAEAEAEAGESTSLLWDLDFEVFAWWLDLGGTVNWLLLLVGVGWSDSSSILASPAISKVRSMISTRSVGERCVFLLGDAVDP